MGDLIAAMKLSEADMEPLFLSGKEQNIEEHEKEVF